MKILHITPVIGNYSSGMSYSVVELVNHQNEFEHTNVDLLIVRKTKANKTQINSNYYYLSDVENLDRLVRSYDLVVFHSTFIFKYLRIYKILKNNDIKYIIVPRGGLIKGALNNNKFKKIIGTKLFFNNYFRNANSYHFLSKNEKRESDIHNIKSFVIPNGIKVRPENQKCIINKNNSPKFIYIGRLNIYHKGLDVLTSVVKNNLEYLMLNNVVIELYGSNEKKTIEYINNQIHKHKMETVLKVYGPIFHEMKFKKLKEADYFIQTSRFEGLPMGVLEALSFGLPCVLTPGTNIADVVQNRNAGISVEFNELSIFKGIKNILKADYSVLAENARLLANEYDWHLIAERTLSEYKKVMNNE